MSLKNQIAIIVSLLLLITLTIVVYKSFHSTSLYLQSQLQTDAKNSATSLGLSISTVENKEDISTIETMINAIFDSGYYKEIKLVDIDNKILYTRSNPEDVKDVPQWFIKNIKLIAPVAQTSINDGWMPFATLSVQGNLGMAYFKLYNEFVELIALFAIIIVISLAILYLILYKVLQSLDKMALQAKAIDNNQFLINDAIPYTTEFASITKTMNKMVEKVKIIFEKEAKALQQYQTLLYKDETTLLANRKLLTMKLQEYLESEELSTGSLIMIHFANLIDANNRIGHREVDNLLIRSAKMFETLMLDSSHIPARLNGTDFAILTPLQTDPTQLIEKILVELKLILKNSVIGIYIGSSTYSMKDKFFEVLTRADDALSKAKAKGSFTYNIVSDSDQITMGKVEWNDLIQKSLQEKDFLLTYQDVHFGNLIYHSEAYIRLNYENRVHNAGFFMPMVEALGYTVSIDRFVIEEAIESKKKSIAINCSLDFIRDTQTYNYLDIILKTKEIELSFEIGSYKLLRYLEEIKPFVEFVQNRGAKFGVDNLNENIQNLEFLQNIKPDYVKIDKQYILELADADTTKKNSLKELMDSLDIIIIATTIENEESVIQLQNLDIEYLQGRYLDEL